MFDIIERLRSWTRDDYRQCSPAQLRTYREELRTAQTGAADAAEAILTVAAGRPLTSPQEKDLTRAHEHMRASGSLLTQVEDELAARTIDYSQAIEGLGAGSPHERLVGSRDAYRRDAPLTRSQTMAGWAAAMGKVEPGQEELDLGRALRGMATGDWSGASAERRTLSGLSTGAGGYLLPTILSSQVIDKARTQSRVLQAGGTVWPMANRVVDVPKWLTDPTPGWRAELAAIDESDAVIGKVTLSAKSLAVITKASREIIEDSDIDVLLAAAFSKKFAEVFDKIALYGAGTATEPRGIKNQAGISTTVLAANGAALANYDPLIDAVAVLRQLDEAPNGQIYSPRTEVALGKTKDTTGQSLVPPPYLDGITRYATTQVPNNVTQGSSSLASDLFTADWSQLLLGVRTEIQITPLKERYADTGVVGFVGWFRGDIALTRPGAFNVTVGIL